MGPLNVIALIWWASKILRKLLNSCNKEKFLPIFFNWYPRNAFNTEAGRSMDMSSDESTFCNMGNSRWNRASLITSRQSNSGWLTSCCIWCWHPPFKWCLAQCSSKTSSGTNSVVFKVLTDCNSVWLCKLDGVADLWYESICRPTTSSF